MSLKNIIREQKILSNASASEFVIPGEPMIYSIKYVLDNNQRSSQTYRNEQWKSILRSVFKSYLSSKTPVVLCLTFYVSPPERENIAYDKLREEKTYATRSYELCDYLLSFQEMLLRVLINSYRQIVRIEAEKYYSANPRTVMRFYSVETYEKLRNKNPPRPKSKSIDKTKQKRPLQSECERDVTIENVCEGTDAGQSATQTFEGRLIYYSPLQDTSSKVVKRTKTPTAGYIPSLQEARLRQSSKVSE